MNRVAKDPAICERCKGTGLVTIFDYDGHGSDADDQPCPEYVVTGRMQTCDGDLVNGVCVKCGATTDSSWLDTKETK